MLCEKYDVRFLEKNLMETTDWNPYPVASDRAEWRKISASGWKKNVCDDFIRKSDASLNSPWPALPAALYMDFVRTGCRSRYETAYFNRRKRLGRFVLAECVEGNGRFIDSIIDGIWHICDEATWCIPAHALRRSDSNPLPVHASQELDLFAAETAMVLSMAAFLLREQLDGISPEIILRIKAELDKRIFQTIEDQGEKIHWMSGINNWTSWCSWNVLGALLLQLDDRRRMLSITHTLMKAVDRFIAKYKSDGACDEGPMYWTVAPGAMLCFLELLHSRSSGRIDIYGNPLISKMGSYISKVFLAGTEFASFADSQSSMHGLHPEIYRYGERIGDESVKNLALHLAEDSREREFCGGTLPIYLSSLFWMPSSFKVKNWRLPLSSAFPDNHILIARENAIDGKGLVVAAKGGSNAENHNHNDIGQFIVYKDGKAVIVDIGRGEYTKETFGPNRYELFFTRSLGHNVPIVNGQEQFAGEEAKAKELSFTDNAAETCISMEISSAYPKKAGLIQLVRKISLERRASSSVTVCDSFKFKKNPSAVEINLLSRYPVKKSGGNLKFNLDGKLFFAYLPFQMEVEIKKMKVTDQRMKDAHGDFFYHLRLSFMPEEKKFSYVIRFG